MRVINNFLKRVCDVVLSLFGLFLLIPMLFPVYIFIAVKYNRPVFFVHQRVGKDGKLFQCIKFRTMVIDAEAILQKWLDENPVIREEFYKDFKLKNDPRILGNIGRFLRKTSLDEIPQIFNIIRGEMAIVGPRPIVEEEIAKYGKDFAYFKSVYPGLTGLWQVSGRNDINYDDRVALDVFYAKNNNVVMDMKIIVKTMRVVILPRGAY